MTDSLNPPTVRRRSPLRRLGCTIALIIWFTLLLAPCFLIVMATQGELTISQGNLPGQQIRLWLIMEADERGLGVSSTSTQQLDLNTIGLQTNINFLLWSGQADALIYCETFTRVSASDPWTPTTTETSACPTP
ncbi:MAG: hypothetical protein IPK17_01225 [Chloroflexi bacterium]|uniref:hypothetical protein n=1 Tax=Candidatus Flexifilum breve TaxID=3140694 RepID=UPI003136368B|nr:hypothetical protein [Chloroflexota bacterium]